jgi:hypothetical protein
MRTTSQQNNYKIFWLAYACFDGNKESGEFYFHFDWNSKQFFLTTFFICSVICKQKE